jgi:hypothetical protein
MINSNKKFMANKLETPARFKVFSKEKNLESPTKTKNELRQAGTQYVIRFYLKEPGGLPSPTRINSEKSGQVKTRRFPPNPALLGREGVFFPEWKEASQQE